MNEEARKLRNEYMRKWRKKNKDKVKIIQERYWERRVKINKEIAKEVSIKNISMEPGGTGNLGFKEVQGKC
ncbi:hypothetical protein [Clostridium tetani]|uniref:Uncharacterized protein n=1 Tax=Clostridium tetani TaxID=1513 RepID=A0ABY0EP75_CLOTA|nr:hypothetical protein [Clostridium tetani]KHO36209.1 hypothetical protein OR62_11260 [Clostridium tetani]RXI55920.1 hypothetical protein DP131_07695 [Clostridium tetani]RXI66045.1 hypothetical protein DQN76_13370 [Clostridium tetani]CDI50305.1 hypothetical protein BN906_02321 [Clostridium tetani 12124569]